MQWTGWTVMADPEGAASTLRGRSFYIVFQHTEVCNLKFKKDEGILQILKVQKHLRSKNVWDHLPKCIQSMGQCYELTVSPILPPNSFIEALAFRMIVLGDRAFDIWLGSCEVMLVGSPWWEIPELDLFLSMCTSEKGHERAQWEGGWLQSKKKVLTRSKTRTSIWYSQPPELWETTVCHFGHSPCGILLWQPELTKSIRVPEVFNQNPNLGRTEQVWLDVSIFFF